MVPPSFYHWISSHMCCLAWSATKAGWALWEINPLSISSYSSLPTFHWVSLSVPFGTQGREEGSVSKVRVRGSGSNPDLLHSSQHGGSESTNKEGFWIIRKKNWSKPSKILNNPEKTFQNFKNASRSSDFEQSPPRKIAWKRAERGKNRQ